MRWNEGSEYAKAFMEAVNALATPPAAKVTAAMFAPGGQLHELATTHRVAGLIAAIRRRDGVPANKPVTAAKSGRRALAIISVDQLMKGEPMAKLADRAMVHQATTDSELAGSIFATEVVGDGAPVDAPLPAAMDLDLLD